MERLFLLCTVSVAGASSSCRWRRRPSRTEGSCKYIG